MDFRKYLTCLWPGLSELWWRGRLSALPLAVGFGIGLNALLTLKYFFPHWLDPLLLRSAWWVGLGGWIYWTVRSVKELPALIEPRSVAEVPDRFADAQAAYLRADWETTEPLLLGILAIEPRDPPALLLLSGLYRHTGRLQNAALLLDELRRLEIADGWQVEIEAEAGRIERDSAAAEADEGSAEADEGSAEADEGSGKSESETVTDGSEMRINSEGAADLTAA